MTIEAVLEILDKCMCHERKKASEAEVEGDRAWAFAHTYGELLLERVGEKIKREDEHDRG